jgi:hypothetical protein
MRNLTRATVVLTMAALGCGMRSDPVPIDASVQARPQDGGVADVPASDGVVDMAVASPDGPADVAVGPGETGMPASTRLFPESSPWYRDVTTLPADVESPAMIAALTAAGGFGGGELLVDFSFELNTADATAPMVALTAGPAFSRPDCDETPVPLPAGGAVRGEAGYECTQMGECHLLVIQPSTRKLFELWKASVAGGVLTAGCLAVWDLSRTYGPSGRGTDCAGADTAGLPITALLFTADEVAAGEIPHALRLSLPTDRIRPGVYLAPATHATKTTTGVMSALPLGARLRLRPDFPVDGLTAGAKVVVKALQRHGMFLAEGGPRALTARSDRSTTARWAGLLGDRDLASVKPGDFTVLDSGPRIPYAGNCVRNP